MTSEVKTIPGYEDYECDIFGNVYSLNYNKTGERRKLKLNKKASGYNEIKLFKNGKRNYFTVHKLVMLTFVGKRPKGLQINHINGIKDDNRLENLEYCTASENALHAFELGLRFGFEGEKNGQSKLNKQKVIEIKTELLNYKRGMISALGRKYEVDPETISNIKNGRTWLHVKID
jgi:hypothetical protein